MTNVETMVVIKTKRFKPLLSKYCIYYKYNKLINQYTYFFDGYKGEEKDGWIYLTTDNPEIHQKFIRLKLNDDVIKWYNKGE